MAYTDYDDLPYAIQQKLLAWKVYDEAGGTSARDAQILIAANSAQGLIDSTMRGLYPDDVPFTDSTIPRLITQISRDLTIWYLIGGQQVRGSAWETNYDKAIESLEKIANYELEVYSEYKEENLSPYDSSFGIESNYTETYDEDEDVYRVFPRTLSPAVPSTEDKYYRDEDSS